MFISSCLTCSPFATKRWAMNTDRICTHRGKINVKRFNSKPRSEESKKQNNKTWLKIDILFVDNFFYKISKKLHSSAAFVGSAQRWMNYEEVSTQNLVIKKVIKVSICWRSRLFTSFQVLLFLRIKWSPTILISEQRKCQICDVTSSNTS